MAKAPVEPDFDLKHQRPSAGEVRRFATGQALFLAPLPLPSGHLPMDLGGSFLQVNDTYLDVGQSNFNKAFQAQLMIWGALCIPIMCLIVAPLIFASMAFGDPYKRSAMSFVLGALPIGALIAALGGGFFGAVRRYLRCPQHFPKIPHSANALQSPAP